ncbi:MAG: MBL fold metallo-hydrolase [Pseudomonadota bacterium]
MRNHRNTLLAMLLLTLPIWACASSKVTQDPADITAPFDGERFQNLEPFEDKHFGNVLWWQLKALFYRERWQDVDDQAFYQPEQARSEPLKVVVINHATVLIQMNGYNILTDPHFSQRASPIAWAGPRRVVQPAIPFEDLPPIDAVLISHDHYDHLDVSTLQRLTERDRPVIFAGLGNRALLEDSGIDRVVEMDWWQTERLGDLELHMVPVQHWSARGTNDRRTTLWGGYVLRGEKQVFFAGDTGYGTGKVFRMIHERLGDMDLSLIPIGAYLPRQFMRNAHVWPQESVKIHQDVQSAQSIGIHFGTFYGLTDEAYADPPQRLKKALLEAGLDEGVFIAPDFGRTYAY